MLEVVDDVENVFSIPTKELSASRFPQEVKITAILKEVPKVSLQETW